MVKLFPYWVTFVWLGLVKKEFLLIGMNCRLDLPRQVDQCVKLIRLILILLICILR